MPPRIAIASSQVPFSRGGAELLVSSLADRLAGRGFEVDVLSVPFSWHNREQILSSALAWRILDLTESDGRPIDLVIGTKYPSYVVRHPNKVVWLVHQFRQAYELQGTRFSDFGALAEDSEVVERIRAMDRRTLGEARRVFTISQNTANRLESFLGLTGEALYPPPALGERLQTGRFDDYVLSVGRLNPMKRTGLLVEAIAACRQGVRGVIVGSGPEERELRRKIEDLGVGERIELIGSASDDQLVDLYRNALAVYYAPYDEDYGYVTIEAMKSGKPVITMEDSGGVLEFVRDGVNGSIVAANSQRAVARQIDEWARRPEVAEELGREGLRTVEEVTWERVLDRLTETL